jgi:hypothetical protein
MLSPAIGRRPTLQASSVEQYPAHIRVSGRYLIELTVASDGAAQQYGASAWRVTESAMDSECV